MLFGSTSLAANVSLTKLNFDPRKDLTPVAGIGVAPNLLIVGPGFPHRTLAEVVAAARAKPNTLTFGSSGTGTGSHLAAELFQARAEINLVHVPYKGSGAALADLVAGRIDLLFEVQGAALGRVKSGQVRALATAAARRVSALPEVPTIAESGYPGFEAGAWLGFFVPAGTPPETVAKLEQAVIASLRDESVRKNLDDTGLVPIPESAAEFGKYFAADIERWAKLVRDARLKPAE